MQCWVILINIRNVVLGNVKYISSIEYYSIPILVILVILSNIQPSLVAVTVARLPAAQAEPE